MDLLFDIVRLLNAVSASLVFGALCYRGRLYFPQYDIQAKLLYISFTLYTFATAYGSVEAYNLDSPPGLRVFPFLIANGIALYAFLRYKDSVFAAPTKNKRS